MKKVTLISIILAPLLLNAMSVSEAVQKSVATHPKIEMKKEEYLSQKELLTRVKADYLPSVNLSYAVGPEVTKTINNNRERESLTRQEASVTLTQNLFAGFETVYGVKQQDALILSASKTVKGEFK